jgi:hypothetical protein
MEHEIIRFRAQPATKAQILLHHVSTTRETVRPKVILHPHEATNQTVPATTHPLLPIQEITTVETIILAQAEGDHLLVADVNHI